MENCSFYSDENVCHQLIHTRNKSLRKVKRTEKDLLASRSAVLQLDIKTVCNHHEQELLVKYSQRQRKCCDPFSRYKRWVKKSLKVITEDLYNQFINPPNSVIIGKKVCASCCIKLKQPINDEYESELEISSPTSSPMKGDISLEDANAVMLTLEETPVKVGGLSEAQKKIQVSQKLQSATQSLKRKLEESYQVELNTTDDNPPTEEAKDIQLYREMMNELKRKFQSSTSYQERVQILTLSPFTIKHTMEEFNASHYLVKKARKTKKEKGILGESGKGKGKSVPNETKEKSKNFYQNDDNSRMCPGKKEIVTVRSSNGEKVSHQKRLVLSNLRELYAKWKTENDGEPKVGFSTFASLRPPWCVLAGASGTHCVCVCKYHQNPRLMAAACLKDSASDLMGQCVCSTEKEQCMMGQCKNCPGKQGIVNYLKSSEEFEDVDEVEYKQWVTTDHTTPVTVKQTVDEYIDTLADLLHNLTRHSFTAKAQSSYMKFLKSSLPHGECILQGDFAENYSFVVQDEIQSFHWENKQATLHPFVAYRCDLEGKLEHTNICVISDSKDHSTTAVWCFQKHVLQYIVGLWPEVNKAHYFTDGCSGQYKNKYNFINMCFHKQDFGLDVEWNFFATSHGKSACDGIGGTVKRLVGKESLRPPYNNQILNTKSMFKYCSEEIPGIRFLSVDTEEIKQAELKLEDCYQKASTIKGTRQFHHFVPKSENTLLACKTSVQSETPIEVCIDKQHIQTVEAEELTIVKSNFVACVYESKWWIGMVEDESEEYDDHLVNFMHPPGPTKQFHWPASEDKCWIPRQNVLCVVEAPSLTSSSSREYHLEKSEEDNVAASCKT